jgi:hypothetical protein
MSTSPLAYLVALCQLQGIKHRLEDDGRTLRLGAGTIVLPANTSVYGDSLQPRLTVVAEACRNVGN